LEEAVTLIYGLFDPRTNELRYVGKTDQTLKDRLKAHIGRRNLTSKRHSSRWISGIINSGARPEIFEIEKVPPGWDWKECEEFWIEYFKSIGCRLTNISSGGEGASGSKRSPEFIENIRAKMTGRTFDDEWRRKISVAKKGRQTQPQTQETISKRCESIKRTWAQRAASRTSCFRGHPSSEFVGIKRRCRVCRALEYQRSRAKFAGRTPKRERIEKDSHHYWKD
jgi:hypothetical protein